MKRHHRWPDDFAFEDYPNSTARAAALDKVGLCPRSMTLVTAILSVSVLVIYLGGLNAFPQINPFIPLFTAVVIGAIIQYYGEKWHAGRVRRWLDDLHAAYLEFSSQDPSYAY